MEMTAIVVLTPEDVRAGRPGDAEYCPLALATKRALGLRSGISVSHGTIGLDGFTIPLGYETRNDISRFDSTRHWPTPRELRLPIPNAALHLIGSK